MVPHRTLLHTNKKAVVSGGVRGTNTVRMCWYCLKVAGFFSPSDRRTDLSFQAFSCMYVAWYAIIRDLWNAKEEFFIDQSHQSQKHEAHNKK